MADYHRTQGFVVDKKDFREADQLFTIYTKDFGRLEILGRAIRKIKSKLRPGVDVFYLSEVEFIQGKRYKTLTDALSIEKFKGITGDLNKLEVAYKILKAFNSCVHCEEKDDKTFNLLEETFSRLDSCALPQMAYYCFLWDLLCISGYKVDLYNCAICRRKLMPLSLCFDCERGGIICKDCSTGLSISPEAVKYLRLFTLKDWQTIFRLKLSEEDKKYLDIFFNNFLLYIGKQKYCN